MIDCSYAVCTTSRSGSTFFRHLLYRHGLGNAKESRATDSLETFLERHVWVNARGQRIMSFKMKHDIVNDMPPGMMRIQADRDAPEQGPLITCFTDIPNLKYIYLCRLNKIYQGISYYFLQQTGSSSIYDEARRKDTAKVPYDFDKIHKQIRRKASVENMWLRLFSDLGITPYVVYYEELLDTPMQVLQGVSDFLGIPPTDVLTPNKFPLILRDARSHEFAKRYKMDLLKRGDSL